MTAAFPNAKVYRAFTSGKVRAKLKDKYDIHSPAGPPLEGKERFNAFSGKIRLCRRGPCAKSSVLKPF